jgi:Trk-type K+ transport system membrane component
LIEKLRRSAVGAASLSNHNRNRRVFHWRVPSKSLQSSAMKFALAVLIYLIMAAILGAGILLLVAGKPWLLIVALIAFVVAFGKIGCMTH